MVLAVLLAWQGLVVQDDQAPRRMQKVLVKVRQAQKLRKFCLWAFRDLLVGFHAINRQQAEVNISCFEMFAGFIRLFHLGQKMLHPIRELELAAVLIGLLH